MGFFLEKLITSFVLPPGFIILILAFAIFKMRKKRFNIKLIKEIIIITMVIVYVLSIEPMKDVILNPLEKKYKPITFDQLFEGDSYIVLGGGSYQNAPNSLINHKGSPTEGANFRLFEVVKLYNVDPKKIIISGGIPSMGKLSEAEIYRNHLVFLGVKKKDILIEGRSRNTSQNVKFTKELLEKEGLKRPILITSAYHMPRSVNTCSRAKIDVIPAPTNYLTENRGYSIYSYFPSAPNLSKISKAIKEYLGGFYYNLMNK